MGCCLDPHEQQHCCCALTLWLGLFFMVVCMPAQASPILRDFAARWQHSVESMVAEVNSHFSSSACGKDVMQVCAPVEVCDACTVLRCAWPGIGPSCVCRCCGTVLTLLPNTHTRTQYRPHPCLALVVGGSLPQASMTTLLKYYTRMLELLKRQGAEGVGVAKDAVNIPAIMYEIKRITKTG